MQRTFYLFKKFANIVIVELRANAEAMGFNDERFGWLHRAVPAEA